MSLLNSVLNFVFGKDPDIFDDKGQVQHKLPKKKWDAWYERTKIDPQHNWRNHSGIAGASRRKK